MADAPQPSPPAERPDADARRLGIETPEAMDAADLIAAIEHRRAIVRAIDPARLRGILAWAGEDIGPRRGDPLRLAERVYALRLDDLRDLDRPGLETLLRLHDIPFDDSLPDDRLRRLLAPGSPIRRWVRRTRRRMAGYVIRQAIQRLGGAAEYAPDNAAHTNGNAAGPSSGEDCGSHRHDEPNGHALSAKRLPADEHVKRKGLVQGMTSYLRGTVDDYLSQKLDEIELRLDAKLDEIDHRMDAWRRREIAHRLRILKFTLIATAVVALVSLLYELVKRLVGGG